MIVKGKYLKDETGTKFSPIVSAETVYMGDDSNLQSTVFELSTKTSYTILYENFSTAGQTNCTLSEAIEIFKWFNIIYSVNTKAGIFMSTGLLPVHTTAPNYVLTFLYPDSTNKQLLIYSAEVNIVATALTFTSLKCRLTVNLTKNALEGGDSTGTNISIKQVIGYEPNRPIK